MTKVLFLLSAVIMVVAGFFSYQNRQAFVDTRNKRHDSDAAIGKELIKLDSVAKEVVTIKGNIKKADEDVKNEQERLAQAKIKLKNAENEAERTAQEIAAKQARLDEVKKDMVNLPPGITIDNLSEHINQIKTTIAANETQVADAEKATKAKQEEVKKAKDQLEDVVKRIEDRKKSFDRNSMTATIVAVNNDWGFVVIDGGQNKGITTDTKLLITRGTETVGKLNIVSVENNKTVANIVQKSIRGGLSVAPGDKVILESLYQ